MINKDTTICISIAEKPGNFGATFHNDAYEALGINFVYIPRKISPSQLEKVIESVRTLNIRGCSVSMPHKTEVIKYLDELDSSALRIGAINTIVNNGGKLKGYNTDYYGAKKALEETVDISGKDIYLIGAGGVAKAIGYAVQACGGKLTIINRTLDTAIDLANKIGARTRSWEKLKEVSGYLLINATPIGMNDPDSMVVTKETLSKFEIVMDAVIYPAKTKLLREAEKLNKQIIPGTRMCVYQAAKQFKLYTGYAAPIDTIEKMLGVIDDEA